MARKTRRIATCIVRSFSSCSQSLTGVIPDSSSEPQARRAELSLAISGALNAALLVIGGDKGQTVKTEVEAIS